MELARAPVIIVTRPFAEATITAKSLSGAGVGAIVWPLLEVGSLTDAAAIAHCDAVLARLADFDCAVFVSPRAVREACARIPAWPASVRACAVGHATADALRARGIAPLTAQLDGSEALFDLLMREPLRGKRYLLLRGPDGRAWLGDALVASGAEVDYVQCYARAPVQIDAAALAVLDKALKSSAPDSLWWSLTSSEAVRHLHASLPSEHAARRFNVLVSHPRIAAAARAAGFARIHLTDSGDQGLMDALATLA